MGRRHGGAPRPATYSSANTPVAIKPPCPAALQVMGEYGINPGPSLVDLDPPEHGRHRQVFRKSFTPERVAALEPRSRELIDAAIDAVAGHGEADVVTDLVWDAPAKIAFALMGVPEYEVDKIKTGTARMATMGWGVPGDDEQVELATQIGEYWNFAGEQVDRLIADPPGEEIHGRSHPGMEGARQRGHVQPRPALLDLPEHAVRRSRDDDERLRRRHPRPTDPPRPVGGDLRGPVAHPQRRGGDPALRLLGADVAPVTTRATTLGGVDLPEGAKLLIGLGSANHDDSHFPDGERFDVRRENAKDQLAFSWGRHLPGRPPGAHGDARVFLERITQRLPHMELVEDQEWAYSPNTSHRGPEHVLVRWDPARNPVPEDRPAVTA